MRKKNKLISLSLFDAFLPEGKVDRFLNNSDSLWSALDRYGSEHGLVTEQLFTITHGLPDTKGVEVKKGRTLFRLVPKNPPRTLLSLVIHLRSSSIVLLNNESYLDIAVAILTKLFGGQVIVFYHNPHDPYHHKLPRWLFHFFLRNAADALLMHSYDMKRDFKPITHRPIFIFKFGFDPDLFPFVERKHGESLRVVTVGRVSPWKRVEDIIEGVHLARSRGEIHLTIVGEDPDPSQAYFDQIKEQLARTGIRHHLAGFMPHSVLKQAYHDAEVFVNMRRDEGFARVFIEAMATGLPVICRRGPVTENLVVNGVNGFIVDTPSDLAAVLDRLTKDKSLLKKLGDNARDFVLLGYSREASYMSLVEALDPLLAAYEMDKRFYQSKSFKKLRRFKRLILNQRSDFCNHVLVDGKIMEKEHYELLRYCTGRGLEIKMGSSKAEWSRIGPDCATGGNQESPVNSMLESSSGGPSFPGRYLDGYKDGELEYVVALHCLENSEDPEESLKAWKRMVRCGGVIGTVVVDDTWRTSEDQIPSHLHLFTPEGFRSIVERIGGLKILRLETCVEDWSFICVMEKTS